MWKQKRKKCTILYSTTSNPCHPELLYHLLGVKKHFNFIDIGCETEHFFLFKIPQASISKHTAPTQFSRAAKLTNHRTAIWIFPSSSTAPRKCLFLRLTRLLRRLRLRSTHDVGEVFVLQGVPRRNPVVRVVLQKLRQQIQPLVIQRRARRVQPSS